MTTILAIDPGNVESAWVLYAHGTPRAWAKEPNAAVVESILCVAADVLAIECIASYGMAVGKTVFETAEWAGRFIQAWGDDASVLRVYRRDVKLHLCGSARAKDTNVRHALIDIYGGSGGRRAAVGVKVEPGPLYGMKADCWQALAVARTAAETRLSGAAA